MSQNINIGEAHNKGLALMLDKLQGLPRTRTGSLIVSDREIEILAIETSFELIEEYEITEDYKKIIYEELDKIVSAQTFDDVELTYSELPLSLETYVRELDEIFTDEDDDLESLLNRVADIETKAKNTLTGQDLESVITACTVTSYTLQYWNECASSWMEVASTPESRAAFSWKKLGRADLQGCMATLGGGATAVLFKCGPVGWKAWAALALGGAVSGSIINAWDQLFPEEAENLE